MENECIRKTSSLFSPAEAFLGSALYLWSAEQTGPNEREINWVCIHTDQLTLTSEVKLHAAIERKNKENRI